MGSTDTKIKNSPIVIIDHPMFKQTKINVENNVKTLQITMTADQTSYEQWTKTLKTQNLRTQFLLLPIKHQYQSKGFCGSAGTITATYENYPQLLSAQIGERKNKNIKFKQTQLWLVLYSLIAAKRDFSFYRFKVGDIRPKNIFLSPDNMIKVANTLSWPSQEINTAKSFNKEITYIAPEQVLDLRYGMLSKKQQLHDPQVFTIGLTVLSTGLQIEMNQLYDLNTMQFNDKVHLQNLEDWKKKSYSQILRGTILNMCQIDADKRVAADQLTNWIQKYHQSIKTLQNFVVTDAPLKIHNQIQQMRQQSGNIHYKKTENSNPIIDFLNSSKGPNLTQAQSIYTPLPSSLYTQGPNNKNFRFTYSVNQKVYQKQGQEIQEKKL